MSKIGERVGLVAAVWGLIARYPALSAGLAQIVIVLGAAFRSGSHGGSACVGS